MRARHNATKTKTPRTKSEKVEIGSGNVFADLGFKDSGERILKATLASKIAQLIEEKRWTQAHAATCTAVDQTTVSRLLRGQVSGFSTYRLFNVLNRLGYCVEVRISQKEHAPENSHTRVIIS